MRVLEKQGLALAYDEAGSGEPPLMFVHGCSFDHTHFAPQMDSFRARHRVIAPDLRGHGASSVPRSGFTPEDFADDLAWLAREIGLQKAVMVGHSLGGVAALALAARHADLVAGVVMLDAPVFAPPAIREAMEPMFQAIMAPGGMDAWKMVLSANFGALDDAARNEAILASAERTPHEVIAQASAGLLAFDAAATAARVKVPVLYVRATVPIDLEAFRAACPSLMTGETVGSGHFQMLEVPDQIDAMISRFLRAM